MGDSKEAQALYIQELEAENRRLKEELKQRKKSEKFLEAFFQQTVFSIAIMDSDYNFIRVNEAYVKACFRNVSDFPGHNHFEGYPSNAREIFDQVVRTKESYTVLARPFTFPNHPEWGVTYWDCTLIPILDSSGEVDLLIFTFKDVTEYVRAEEKLRESEERYLSIFENSLDGIILSLPDGSILSANPAACRMFGQTEEELGDDRNGIVDLADPRVRQALQEREKTGSFHAEMTLVRKDKTKFPVEVTANLFKDQDGRTLSIMIARDITERKQSEEARRLSEEKFSKAFYLSQTMMAISRLEDGVYIDMNDTWAAVLGYHREEMIGKSAFALKIWADPQDRQEMQKQIAENGFIKSQEYKFKRKTGETSFVLATVNKLDIDGENCLLVSAIDVTESKKAEEALRLSEELLNKTFNCNPFPMVIISRKHEIILEVNKTFLRRSGYTRKELIGVRLTDLGILVDAREHLKIMREIKKKGFVYNFEARLSPRPGETAIFLFSGCIITWHGEECVLGIANEITELKRYQQEAARLERLHLVGQMAAGIGHEIRNPITTVRGFLQLLKGKERYAQDQGYLDLMIEEIDRANTIITEYLSLARNKVVDKKRQSLNERIEALFPLLSADVTKNDIGIHLELGAIPELLIDKNEIYQLLLNLVRNGIEAMAPGGLLTIKTFQAGSEVVLAVQDQGQGIAPEVLEKIGTPFFTTKNTGTGLGLATCYSIAHRHQARIEVETGGSGTTFYVKFKEN